MFDKRFHEIMEENDCTQKYEGKKPIPSNWSACDFGDMKDGTCECHGQYLDEQPDHPEFG